MADKYRQISISQGRLMERREIIEIIKDLNVDLPYLRLTPIQEQLITLVLLDATEQLIKEIENRPL